MFIRITKKKARQLFIEDKSFSLCPCKLIPSFPFCQALRVNPKDWKKQPEDNVDEAFEALITDWVYYNASYEVGYYPHYYIEE